MKKLSNKIVSLQPTKVMKSLKEEEKPVELDESVDKMKSKLWMFI